jgi:hypothetical protein
MTARFDIFRIETNGGVRWHQSAETLDEAKAQIQQLAALSPGQFLVLNQETGNKLIVPADGASPE